MTFVVWRHPIPGTLDLPDGAQVIHVGTAPGGEPCLWEMHRQDAGVASPREFLIAGTGHPFPGGTPVGSVVDGPFVWHVFEAEGSGSDG